MSDLEGHSRTAWLGTATSVSSWICCSSWPSVVNSRSWPLSRHVTSTWRSLTDSPLGFSPVVHSQILPAEPRASIRRIQQLVSSAMYRQHHRQKEIRQLQLPTLITGSTARSAKRRNISYLVVSPITHFLTDRPHRCAQNFPDFYLRLPGIVNYPFCCMTLLATEWSLLQRTCYNEL